MVNIPRTRPARRAEPRGAATSRLYGALVVRPALRGLDGHLGHLRVHPMITLPCALGRGGISHRKREGDGATPAGAMRLLHGYFRPDRVTRPLCRISLRRSHPKLGWCDDARSPVYNRPAPLPMTAGHEEMWRTDGLYDVVFALDYNMAPRRKGLGSAIFLHCARPGLTATLGCVAVRPADMRRLLPRLSPHVRLIVV